MEKMHNRKKKSHGEKTMDSNKTPGAAYMKGRKPKMTDPSCAASGYLYGHSNYAKGKMSY